MALKNKAVQNRFIPLLAASLVISLSLFSIVDFLNSKKKSQTSPTPEDVKVVQVTETIKLPKPVTSSKLSVEAALQSRRSLRNFLPDKLNLKQIGQMLWAAQGVTSDWGGRTTPSAKSVYPLTVYLVAFSIDGLNPGLYQYLPGELELKHELIPLKLEDLKEKVVTDIAQNSPKEAPALLIITGNFSKMTKAFGNIRHDENVYLEAGHATQNLYLQAQSLGLGMVALSDFDLGKLHSTLELPSEESLIYAIPVGFPQK